MKHTPTPWKITNSGYDDNLIYKIQIGTASRTVAYAYSSDGDKQDEQVANAAHIVKCVNEQPAKDVLIAELVEALEEAQADLEIAHMREASDEVRVEIGKTIIKVRSALTKARGGDNA